MGDTIGLWRSSLMILAYSDTGLINASWEDLSFQSVFQVIKINLYKAIKYLGIIYEAVLKSTKYCQKSNGKIWYQMNGISNKYLKTDWLFFFFFLSTIISIVKCCSLLDGRDGWNEKNWVETALTSSDINRMEIMWCVGLKL